MKKTIVVCVVSLLALQFVAAQGTVYLSNLDQTSADSIAVGSDSWLAESFRTGNNVGGFTLNSIQLAMTNASGNPSSFTVMVYSATVGFGISPGSSLGTLNGSLDPVPAGNYTYTPASNLTLSPSTEYYIVLTAGTVIANGAYDWSVAGANSYNPSGGWMVTGGVNLNFYHSTDGLSWSGNLGTYPQFAITATAVPEPGVLGLLGLGGLAFLWHLRQLQ